MDVVVVVFLAFTVAAAESEIATVIKQLSI